MNCRHPSINEFYEMHLLIASGRAGVSLAHLGCAGHALFVTVADSCAYGREKNADPSGRTLLHLGFSMMRSEELIFVNHLHEFDPSDDASGVVERFHAKHGL
jgi:hypothetical protein